MMIVCVLFTYVKSSITDYSTLLYFMYYCNVLEYNNETRELTIRVVYKIKDYGTVLFCTTTVHITTC